VLEARSLLSVTAAGTVAAAWGVGGSVNPSSTVLVRFDAGVPASRQAADLDAVGGRVVTAYPDGPEVVALPPWADRAGAAAQLRAGGDVAYAEADATFHAAGTPVTPNDPLFGEQWGLQLIDAPYAWSITTGTPATVVAVLDTGIDLASPEFAGRLWVNAAASTAFHPVYGWNFVANNGNTQDDNGHGSHVSGILAATGNNAYGIAGVDWGTQIMPLKILDSQGNGSTDTAVAAIYFAVQHGARVINASWGGDVYSQAMLDALNYANAAGAVFVTAAGNDGLNNDVNVSYPASYRTPNELVVAAVDEWGNLASYSNFGPATVDLAAPGSDVISTVPGGFATYSGTSMATPYVSGTVALLAGLHPGLSAAQLATLVRVTAKPLPALTGRTISGGVVDPLLTLAGTVASGGGPVSASSTLVLGGSTPEAVEAAVLSSDGVYAAVGGTPQGFVTEAFSALFGRAPDPAALAYYTAAMANGMTRAGIVHALQGTSEALSTRAARWLRDEFGWPGSLDALKANPAVAGWAFLFASGQSDADVQAGILGSDPFYAAVGGTPKGFVTEAFNALFGRAPDPAALAYYTAALASGFSRTRLVRVLLGTSEAHDTVIARLFVDEYGWTGSLDALKANPGVNLWAAYLGGS
jgi:subtilisin family serine protease